jgi:hypothetical protein
MARPTTIRTAAGILDLSERQVQRMAPQLGGRRASKKQQRDFGFGPEQWVLDGDKVQQLRRARVKAEIRRAGGR